MATPNVLFSRGSSISFPSIVKDPNTLYFLIDTHEIFLGNERYAFGNDISIVVSGEGDVVTDVTYSDTNKTLTLVKGNAGDTNSVTAAIQTALSRCVKTIASERGSAISVDSSDPENIKLSLNIAKDAHAGNVNIEECSEGLRASVDIPAPTVTGVQADDKMLALSGTNLTSTLSVTTEKADGTVYVVLKGINDVEISKFDASDFVKAGMLKSASLEDAAVSGQVHRLLVLEFNIEGGQTETLKVDLNEFIDIYTAAPNGGLALEGGAFSIDNSVQASDGLNGDAEITFGSTLTLKTVKFNDKGLITETKDVNFTIPKLSGTVGDSTDKSTLLTSVNIDDSGVLSGDTIDLVLELTGSVTDAQVPTAQAVKHAIDAAVEATATNLENYMLVNNGSAVDATIALKGDPTNPLDAATKQYVDAKTAGLSGAMHFLGVSTTKIEDGERNLPTIDGRQMELEGLQNGDVVVWSPNQDNHYIEFIWDGSKWVQYGDESSFAHKDIEIIAGPGLLGGGTLASNVTLSVEEVAGGSKEFKGTKATEVIYSVTRDEFGRLLDASVLDIKPIIDGAIADAMIDPEGGRTVTELIAAAKAEAIQEAKAYTDEALRTITGINVVVVGAGNAVLDVTYDSATKTLTIHKGDVEEQGHDEQWNVVPS